MKTRTNQQIIDDLERKITVKMSVNIIAGLLKAGITIPEMAAALRVSVDFLHRVQKKQHSFKFNDLRRLAKLSGQTPQLLFLNSMRPIRPDLKELFDITQEMLEVCGAAHTRVRRTKARRVPSKAA